MKPAYLALIALVITCLVVLEVGGETTESSKNTTDSTTPTPNDSETTSPSDAVTTTVEFSNDTNSTWSLRVDCGSQTELSECSVSVTDTAMSLTDRLSFSIEFVLRSANVSSLVIFESGEFGGIDCGSLAGYCEFDFQEGLEEGHYLLHLEIEIDNIGTIRLQHFFEAKKGGSEDEESSSAIKIVGPVIVVVIFVFVAGIGLFFFTKFYCGREKKERDERHREEQLERERIYAETQREKEERERERTEYVGYGQLTNSGYDSAGREYEKPDSAYLPVSCNPYVRPPTVCNDYMEPAANPRFQEESDSEDEANPEDEAKSEDEAKLEDEPKLEPESPNLDPKKYKNINEGFDNDTESVGVSSVNISLKSDTD